MSVLERIGEQITTRFGLVPRPDWEAAVGRAAGELAGSLGVGLDELLLRVRGDRHVLHELAGRLTVGETHFFRQPAHFDVLTRYVARRLPELSVGETIQMWSAGCASGEEPYSAAIAVHARLGHDALARLRVMATDLDPRALAKARDGAYTAWSFRGTPGWVLSGYFRGDDSRGCVLVDGPVRRAVTFELSDLLERARSWPHGTLDVVSFRNVAMYMDPDVLQRLYDELRRALRPDGVLLLGPSDPRPRAGLFAPDREEGEHTVLRPSDPAAEERDRARAGSGARPADAPSGRGPVRRGRRRTVPARPRALVSASSAPRQGATAPAASSSSGRRLPGPPPPAGERLAPAAILQLGDEGQLDRAIAAATALVRKDSGSGAARLLLGQLLVGAQRHAEAVQELRRAVFLLPEDLLARYWYATALVSAGSHARARGQLADLIRRLESRDPDAVLEDDQTSATELLRSASLLQEAIT